jgi:hypothetical protein
MRIKDLLIENIVNAGVQIKADEYYANVKKTIPNVFNMLNQVVKGPKPTYEQLQDAAEAGYKFLQDQLNTDNWDQKVKQAGEIVKRHISDIVTKQTNNTDQ